MSPGSAPCAGMCLVAVPAASTALWALAPSEPTAATTAWGQNTSQLQKRGAQVKLPSGHPGAAEVSGDLLHSGQGLGGGFAAFLHKGCTPQNSTFLAPALKLHRMMAPQVYHELLNGTCCPQPPYVLSNQQVLGSLWVVPQAKALQNADTTTGVPSLRPLCSRHRPQRSRNTPHVLPQP